VKGASVKDEARLTLIATTMMGSVGATTRMEIEMKVLKTRTYTIVTMRLVTTIALGVVAKAWVWWSCIQKEKAMKIKEIKAMMTLVGVVGIMV